MSREYQRCMRRLDFRKAIPRLETLMSVACSLARRGEEVGTKLTAPAPLGPARRGLTVQH